MFTPVTHALRAGDGERVGRADGLVVRGYGGREDDEDGGEGVAERFGDGEAVAWQLADGEGGAVCGRGDELEPIGSRVLVCGDCRGERACGSDGGVAPHVGAVADVAAVCGQGAIDQPYGS